MRIFAAYLFFVCLLTSVSANAQTDCAALNLNIPGGATSLNADNFPTLQMNVVRASPANNGCNFFVTIDYGDATSFSARSLSQAGGFTYPVQIYKDSGRTQIIKTLADASSNADVLNGAFLPNDNATTQLIFRPYLDPSLYRRFGSYSDTFTARLYKGTVGGTNSLQSTRSFTLTYTQSKKIDVALVDTGQAFNLADTSQVMDFGQLATGASRSFDFIVSFNAGYQLTITSANNGNLSNTTQPGLIAYTMTVQSTVIPLATGAHSLASVPGISPDAGMRLPVQVTIGSLLGKPGGFYQDTVTFSVISTE